jgi:hypothetical protein
MTSFIEQLEQRALLSGDFVIDWNNVAIDVLRADTTLPGPGFSSRALAIMHGAVFDAVNGIARTHRSIEFLLPAPGGTNMNAAIATAAHAVLTRLYPDQREFLNQRLVQSLAEVPNGIGEIKGIIYGRLVAEKWLFVRRDDGAFDVVEYEINPAPGHWQPDPLNLGQSAWGPGWGLVDTFGLLGGDQFLPPHPPALSSAQYAQAYNEVKSLGEKNSTTRTAEQTEIGIFWAYDRPGTGTPPVLYNQVTQVIADNHDNTPVENARLFALVNLAQADAGISSWDCKYKEDLWRPITAIRRGAEDGNPDTVADPTWVPLGAPGNGTTIPDFTPPFPAYVSGHATFGAAAFQAIARFYGTDQMNFTLTSDELPGVTRSYTSLSQASAENARSRIYLGIHWNFDDVEGRALGGQVGNWIFDHVARPRPHDGGQHMNETDTVFGNQNIGTTRKLIDDTPLGETELELV